MKCANCPSDALFEYQISKRKSIFYCGKDLPGFLESQRKAGLLKITQEFKNADKSVEEKLTSSVTAIEEPVAVEEEQKPVPVKKTPKKSAK
jgi:hypothetical protein